ncbi:Universal stress protein A [Quillaja saponaria]|uniref:Universal stress protein A n=1 Tax=Quillaja saponaria TaxID=32244 RepID=A0AAD7VGX5_QUISA|nr:Universal stress protein A [Quillaja saponaria]
MAGPGALGSEVFPTIEVQLKVIAEDVIQKAKVDNAVVEVVEGEARNVLCDAVDKHQASILVVGSHGYGVIKRAVLGSVTDYCAHHVHCTVMIVKKPKMKH